MATVVLDMKDAEKIKKAAEALKKNPGFNDGKDKFKELDTDWKDAVAASTPEQLDAKIVELVKAEEENQATKASDPQLAELKEQLKEAGAGYKEATKGFKLRVKFILRVLGDKGKA